MLTPLSEEQKMWSDLEQRQRERAQQEAIKKQLCEEAQLRCYEERIKALEEEKEQLKQTIKVIVKTFK
jgi:hypothetical protein